MKLRNLQALRALAALAVVFYHIGLWEHKELGAAAIAPSCFGIGAAGVDLFFVISGFIMVFIEPEPISSFRSHGRFLAHRITRIYPPLWGVLLPLLLLWTVRPGFFNSYHGNDVDLAGSFFLLPQNQLPLLSVSWTLIHEVYFYLVVSFALTFSARGRAWFGIVWFLLVLGVYQAFGVAGFHGNRFLQLVFSPFSLTFLLGYFLGLFHRFLHRLPTGWIAAGAVLGLGLFLPGFHSLPNLGLYPDNNLLQRWIGYGLPAALLVAGAVAIENRFALSQRLIQTVGNASYAIYLVHLPLIMGFYAVMKHFPGATLPERLGMFLLCLIGTVSIGVAFHFWVERPLLWHSRKGIDALFPEKKFL